ncbi:hypothetical protein [Streptomyces sp. NPDC090112]|uniref:hypothetical protein n=1 Tax=Streptomyces sp. NPDC090112 TaxID=3365949 RepID=UPI0037F4E568
MSTSELPGKAPAARGRTCTLTEPQPESPSRSLRIRAAGGWERFMRRAEISLRQEAEE